MRTLCISGNGCGDHKQFRHSNFDPTSSSPELGMSSQNSATLLVKLTFDPAVSTSTAVLPCQEAPEHCSSVSLKSARLSAAKNTLYPPGKTACFRQALCLPQSQLSARRSCTPEPRCRLSLSAAAIRLARRVVATDCAAWGLVKQDAATRPCPHSPHRKRKRKRRLNLTIHETRGASWTRVSAAES